MNGVIKKSVGLRWLVSFGTIAMILTSGFFTQAANLGDLIGVILGPAERESHRPGRDDWGYDRRGRYENVVCSAEDKGWEEHWGGHSSCDVCLSKHGECVESCHEQSYRCTAEGSDQTGSTQTFQAQDITRWRAEDEALYRCQRYLYNCRITSCQEEQQLVSRRDCRR